MTNFEILLFCSRGNLSIKLQRHGCSSKDLLHNFITPFTKSTSGEVFLLMWVKLLLAVIWPLWCCSIAPWCCSGTVVPWCSGYDYCTTSFNKPWTQVLCRFKPCLRHVGGLQWWGSLTMALAGNKVKYLSSVNHTTKTIHYHHHHHSWRRKILMAPAFQRHSF